RRTLPLRGEQSVDAGLDQPAPVAGAAVARGRGTAGAEHRLLCEERPEGAGAANFAHVAANEDVGRDRRHYPALHRHLFKHTLTPCGSEPARESGISGDTVVEHADAFASRLAPTGLAGSITVRFAEFLVI